MKYVFGPVPSRRLGQSLGIDTLPLKTCNWNCVYCQLGRTRPVTNERKNFFPPTEILSQVQGVLKTARPGEIDWITFVGSGETTLYASLGVLIRQVKSITSIPVAVITNGSLLYLPDVRQGLSAADAVLPTLDAGNEALYRKINRPHAQITFNRMIEGLSAFRSEYTGKLWVEVMLIKGLNDSKESLTEIAAIFEKVKPDEIHIVQPDRPPVETWVQPPSKESLSLACDIFGKITKIVKPAAGSFDLSTNENLLDAIIGIITRHPMKESELIESLSQFSPNDVVETLSELEKSGLAQTVMRNDIKFWSASNAYYPINKNNG